jgi:isopenicillin N synthase-like dioxygenase
MAIPHSRRLNFSEIPQIDLSSFDDNQPDPSVIKQLANACTEVGFFYVRNHGVESQLVEELHYEAQRFFNQSIASKMEIKINERMRGYLPSKYASYEGEENAGRSHQEGFWMGYDRPLVNDFVLNGRNLWPNNQPELKDVMNRYFTATEELSLKLLRGFELALLLEEGTLSAFFEKPMSMLKLNHYPHQESPENVNDIGVVPHSDSGAFTILWQDNGSGLEIQNKSGEWISAPSIQDTFVINLGNIMQMWTNGRFSSTRHRVINRECRERYSIPVFVNPGRDVKIGPLEAGKTSDSDSVVFGEYIQELWRRTFPIANIPPL